MIVKINSDIFNNSDCFDDLDDLIRLFERRHHRWDIDNDLKIKESEWLAPGQNIRVERRVEDIIEKSFVNSGYITQSMRRDRHTIRITLTPEKDNEFTPEDAFKFLTSPVHVVVENYDSDRTFLEAVIRAYKKEELRVAIDNEWIIIEGMGGIGQIPNRIDAYYESHKDAYYESSQNVKLYILVDSDREHPGDAHSSQAEKVFEKCKEKGIEGNLTILYKRAIENYLPLNALAEVPDALKHVYEAYKLLDDPNKWDFYNMKGGFGVRNKKGRMTYNKLPKKQERLFYGIKKGDTLFEDLKEGFKMKDFHLYSLFKKEDKITKAALQERCEHQEIPDELEKLLKGILSLL
ncbi:hypothetical protein QUF72_05590 [Desulfobacterales bacterium HSG2]|nr:hypothetical protein [Desulfobacterales bacterium HSG2]